MSPPPPNPAAARPLVGKLWQSGIILSAASFLTLGIHWLFQFIVSPQLGGTDGEYGLVLATIAFVGFLGIPLQIASQAVTHYIARFHFNQESDRLHGLLAGCRKFLLQITVGGSIIAIILVKPLGDYFNIPRTSLTLTALGCTILGLWGAYLTALCQGLGWFKRLALVGLLAALLRLAFGGLTTRIWPTAEWAVAASGVMVLANLVLFYWKKYFPPSTEKAISPWTPEFRQFLFISLAWAFGTNCFIQGDLLVANKFFPRSAMDAYGSAGLLARALPTLVGPLLAILFTHRSRSHQHHADDVREQLRLIGLYAVGLVFGAACLYALRQPALLLLHRNTPEANAMIARLAITMVFVGLLQALGTWALASRWLKIALLYGVLGLIYWLALFAFGQSPATLLTVMPLAAGLAFVVLFVFWLIAMRRGNIAPADLS